MDEKEARAWLAGRVLSAKRSRAEAVIFVPNANAVHGRLEVRAEGAGIQAPGAKPCETRPDKTVVFPRSDQQKPLTSLDPSFCEQATLR